MKMNRFVIWFVTGVFVFESICASETCYMHSVVHVCPDPNESCSQLDIHNDTGVCKCKIGYTKRNPTKLCTRTSPITPREPQSDDTSTTPEPEHLPEVSGSTIAASILIPLVLVVVVVGLVYSARRYQWLHRLHQLRHRRYDEVRIGREDDDDDDDPPIA